MPDGLLERFLGVLDTELDRVHDKTAELLDLRSVDRIPDRYLPLLAAIVGHKWNSLKSYHWNRERIRHAVRTYSYKGTIARLRDLLAECQAKEIVIQDNASRLCIPGKQGRPGHPDCHVMAPDYNHDGAFVLRALDLQDQDYFDAGFADGRTAGEVWYFDSLTNPAPYCEVESEIIPPVDNVIRMDCTTLRMDSRDWTIAPVLPGE